MAEADEQENLAKEVSEFLNKCYKQLPARHLGLETYLYKRSYPADHPVDGTKCRAIPVVTGSKAEFYIDPMLKCFGDVDIMYHYSNELAIPVGHQPPTQLPTEFDSRVKVFELVDSHVPGYVYLNLKCMLSKRKTGSRYTVAINRQKDVLSHELYVTAGIREYAEIHGPSACIADASHNPGIFGLPPADTVPCVRCLIWPKQAATWPTRHRNYDWPDSETVARAVSNGCDVVGVAHTLCAQDEWMSKHQWRLSFSRAEVVLLNSWTPIQQMIYHMIRIFMKKERLIGLKGAVNTDKSMFSNYHIKTMMLWACEIKPMHWWTDGTNLVSLSVQCFLFLEEWITKRRGQHYFIKSVHFLNYVDTLSVNTVTAVVKSTTDNCLAQWFVDNYMHKCAELCPDNLPILYSDVVTKEMVHDTATAILKWKNHIFVSAWLERSFSSTMSGLKLPLFRSWDLPVLDHLFTFVRPRMFSAFVHEQNECDTSYADSGFFNAFLNIVDNVVTFPLKNEFMDCIVLLRACDEGRQQNQGSNILHTLFNVFLNTSDTIEKFPLNKVLDFVASLFGYDISRYDTSTSSNDTNSLPLMSKAVAWMKIVDDKQHKSHQVVDVYLAKEYLVRAMRCTDSDSDSIYGVANVYMAVLCYITGQYQKASDHCALVTRSQGHPHCSSHVVDGELLPKIDDDIDTVLGLAVFYQYLRTTVLKQLQHTQHAGVFTTELFAHYFNIRHMLVVNCHLARQKHVLRKVKFHLREEMKLFFHRILSAPRLFVTDLMLLKYRYKSSPRQLSSIAFTNADSCNRQKLAELLTQRPIQQLLSNCRHMPREEAECEFLAIVTSSDFTVLRLYRCKLYERCMQLCQRAVNEMIEGHVRPITRLCFMYKEFVQLMDDKIVSLIGMTVLVDKPGTQSKSKLKEPLNISQLTMSLYLLTQCQTNVLSSKLQPDISPLADILELIGEAEKITPSHDALDQLILKLAERLSVMYITERLTSIDEGFL